MKSEHKCHDNDEDDNVNNEIESNEMKFIFFCSKLKLKNHYRNYQISNSSSSMGCYSYRISEQSSSSSGGGYHNNHNF